MEPLAAKPPAVLIIDDEQRNRSRLTELFVVLGLPTYTAENALRGLDIFRSNKEEIDLVFLDMLLPGTDSDDILKQLKKINSGVKIICMSNNTKEIAKRIREMADVGIVEKPVTINRVLNELNEITK